MSLVCCWRASPFVCDVGVRLLSCVMVACVPRVRRSQGLSGEGRPHQRGFSLSGEARPQQLSHSMSILEKEDIVFRGGMNSPAVLSLAFFLDTELLHCTVNLSPKDLCLRS